MKQLTIFDCIEEQTPIVYGDRGCKVCGWFNKGECQWKDNKFVRHEYPNCMFRPSEYKVPRMCANCEYANLFHYEIKEEYEEECKKHGNYSKKAADDPKEEPNIYCTHYDGSLNRRTEYKDVEVAGFGVGHWHQQHEWDTCDRWKLDNSIRFKEMR